MNKIALNELICMRIIPIKDISGNSSTTYALMPKEVLKGLKEVLWEEIYHIIISFHNEQLSAFGIISNYEFLEEYKSFVNYFIQQNTCMVYTYHTCTFTL